MRMAGHDVLMVSGTDEHGTPILVAADKAGVSARSSPTRTTGSSSQDLVDLGLSYDLFTRTTTAQPLRASCRSCSPRSHRNGYMVERTTQGAISPSTGPHPARPLHRGHLPDLRLRRARAATSATTAATSSTRTDLINPRQQDQRRDPRVRRDPALLPRPARARRRAARVARGARGVGHLAAQRHQVQPQHPRGHQAAGDDPRHRLGHPGPARRLARAARPSGSTCGSTRSSATCRRRSSGPAASVSPSAGASGGTTRRPCPTTSWARTTSSSTPRSGRPSCSRTTARAPRAASPGPFGELQLPTEVVSSEFLTMESKQFSTSRGHVI